MPMNVRMMPIFVHSLAGFAPLRDHRLFPILVSRKNAKIVKKIFVIRACRWTSERYRFSCTSLRALRLCEIIVSVFGKTIISLAKTPRSQRKSLLFGYAINHPDDADFHAFLGELCAFGGLLAPFLVKLLFLSQRRQECKENLLLFGHAV